MNAAMMTEVRMLFHKRLAGDHCSVIGSQRGRWGAEGDYCVCGMRRIDLAAHVTAATEEMPSR